MKPSLRDKQVVLRRPTLDSLPDSRVPDGYRLRRFRPGDETDWQAVYDAAFPDIPDRVSEKVSELMASDLWNPDRVSLACLADRPVACAVAWEPPWNAPGAGVVHWVATLPAHRRRGLGRAVVLDALQWMRRTGRRTAVLITEVHRTAALRLYLDLGFEPDFGAAADMDRRWALARENLSRRV
jgi:mycothiol synthase